jgi:hypothetical protein
MPTARGVLAGVSAAGENEANVNRAAKRAFIVLCLVIELDCGAKFSFPAASRHQNTSTIFYFFVKPNLLCKTPFGSKKYVNNRILF